VKILLINKYFFLNGGSETVMFSEREYFKRQEGVEVYDFSMQHPRNVYSEHSEFFVEEVDYKGSALLGKFSAFSKFVHNWDAVKKLELLLKKYKPDIAHLHNIYHQITPSIIPVLKKYGVKVVLTLHDYKLICPSYTMLREGEICEKCVKGGYIEAFKNRCQGGSIVKSGLLSFEAYYHKLLKSYDGVDLYISPSKFMVDKISERIPKRKIVLLSNGVGAESGVSTSDAGYILYFGRISKEKGIKTLLEAYRASKQKLKLKVVGDGELFKELKEIYAEYVDFLGYKSGDSLAELINNASFVVVPSEWYENCSMSVIEAMASGKPIVGSRIGGIPEQIVDGVSGVLFEPGNIGDLQFCIDSLSDDVQLREKMGFSTRKLYLDKYCLERHNNKLLELYRKLLGEDCRVDDE
jgi:glycosyltransferase involved in cell wall biosynthesis